MNPLVKLLTLGTVLASAAIASATTISGGINIGGTDSFDATAITFNPTTGFVTGANGNLASFYGSTVALTSFSYNAAAGVQIFKTTNSLGDMLAFTDVTLAPAILGMDQNGRPTLTLAGTGNFTETGVGATAGTFTPTLGSFTLTSSTSAGGGSTITGFQLVGTSPIATSVTPEPSSLILLGTGLTSAAGMLVRRRRNGYAPHHLYSILRYLPHQSKDAGFPSVLPLCPVTFGVMGRVDGDNEF